MASSNQAASPQAASSPPGGAWRLLWLAGLAACLAWVLHLSSSPGSMRPRVPWELSDAAAAGRPRASLVNLGEYANLDAIAADRASAFLERTLIGLNGIADRINLLRRTAADGLTPLSAAGAEELRLRFEVELDHFDRYAATFESEGRLPLDVRAPIVVQLGERGLHLRLDRWRTTELSLPEVDFGQRPEVERLLEALNTAYYRLVSEYRELKALRAQL